MKKLLRNIIFTILLLISTTTFGACDNLQVFVYEVALIRDNTNSREEYKEVLKKYALYKGLVVNEKNIEFLNDVAESIYELKMISPELLAKNFYYNCQKGKVFNKV